MDANGLRFWMLAEPDHWRILGDPAPLQYSPERRCLRLASQRVLPVLPEAGTPSSEAAALGRLERIPQARDRYGSWAYWDAGAELVRATGAGPGAVPIFAPRPGETPTDLAIGYDGVLYLALAGGIAMSAKRRAADVSGPKQTVETIKEDVKVAKESLSKGAASEPSYGRPWASTRNDFSPSNERKQR